jgi:hypothetical protein
VGRHTLYPFAPFRGAPLGRIVALCFIVLTACPFTAPFSTFDVDHSRQSSHCPDITKTKPRVDGAALAPCEYQDVSACWLAEPERVTSHLTATVVRRAWRVVLRL